MSLENRSGHWNIIKEHKFTIVLLLMIAVPLAYGYIYHPAKGAFDGAAWFICILIYICVSTVLFYLSVLLEMPHSRYLLLRVIGTLAWAALFLSALLTGWKRWIEF